VLDSGKFRNEGVFTPRLFVAPENALPIIEAASATPVETILFKSDKFGSEPVVADTDMPAFTLTLDTVVELVAVAVVKVVILLF